MHESEHQPKSYTYEKQEQERYAAAYRSCSLCPRQCGADRFVKPGFCGAGASLRIARASLHHWEETCLCGTGGSGAVFFSGCTLRCCFCQNYKISAENFGADISARRLADIFLRLAAEGAENINLVTPTQYLPGILAALDLVRHRLSIPVVYNCGGYERVETIRQLDGYVDIYLPDFKYADDVLAERYSSVKNYRAQALAAVSEMIAQCGCPDLDVPAGTATLKRGVIIRHMVLPSHRKDSIEVLRLLDAHFPKHHYLLSLMSQYTPFFHAGRFPELSRRLTSYEYDSVLREAQRLDFRGYLQERTSAKEEYTPPFDLEGVSESRE